MVLAGVSLGWTAALCAMAASGSFGVPIKSETARRVDIDPLVFQTYKTVMSLAFSVAITRLLGYPLHFSPWGIVSGLFWVPGGVATIFAVKILGLGLAVAVGNSLVAIVSFLWGIFVFHEKVTSKAVACIGVLMMVVGFTGMSFYSLKEATEDGSENKRGKVKDPDDKLSKYFAKEPRIIQQPFLNSLVGEDNMMMDDETYCSMTSLDDSCSVCSYETNTTESSPERSPPVSTRRSSLSPPVSEKRSILQRRRSTSTIYNQNSSPLSDLPLHAISDTASPLQAPQDLLLGNRIGLCGMQLSRWQMGLLVAICGGIWGGSVLVPMQFCQKEDTGLGYLVSFSVGASIVTLSLWVLRFLHHAGKHRCVKKAFAALPSFHLQEMWLPGGSAGLLWSIGNFFSILAVQNLGEGVGYCAVQASMLVGGLWGIFYFKEVKGVATIAKWLLSALLTISGIAVLGYEHGI